MFQRLLFVASLTALLLSACKESNPAPSTETPAPPSVVASPDAASAAVAPADLENSEELVIGHRFEKAEDWLHRFEGPERDEWQKPSIVIKAMNIKAGMVIADIGAGTGYFLGHLSQATGKSGQVLGVDIEPDMIRYMSERIKKESLTNAKAQLSKPDSPELATDSVDRILLVNTWHHIGQRDAYSKKLAAALKKGGEVYIVDFTMESPRGPPPEERLLPPQVIKELEGAGLKGEEVPAEGLPYQWIVRARK